jgi:hypothetical protein
MDTYPDTDSLSHFEEADLHYSSLKKRLCGDDTRRMSHADLEELLEREGRELLRKMLQSHLDLRSEKEVREPLSGSDNVPRNCQRERTRGLNTVLGPVRVKRIAMYLAGIKALMPMDAELNLPKDSFSFGVQKKIAVEVSRGSFSDVVEVLASTTGTAVGKRQVEELARQAAVDFDAFYAATEVAEPSGAIMVLSVDGKGIVMREKDLRDATKKAARKAGHKLKKRLSGGEKLGRKRMSTVAAVYSINPNVRTPEEVIGAGTKDAGHQARPNLSPTNKRVWASVEKEPEEVIEEAFREADERDPQHRLVWVVLLDGNKTQIRLVRKIAARYGVKVTIVLDIIHVIEYLWKAAWCLFTEGSPDAETWVTERLLSVLKGKSSDVAAGIRRSATKQELAPGDRKGMDKCADYLLKYKNMLHYDDYLARGLPIATGIIEGACRYIVKDRMDITGARWGLAGAEAVLRLRSLKASGDLEEYWQFHQWAELRRNHLSRYAANELPDLRACANADFSPQRKAA